MLKIDHFYVSVTDLNQAIEFYQFVLERPITHREGDRWADFSKDDIVYLGIFNTAVEGERFSVGTSPTLCLKTDNINQERERIAKLNPKSITDIVTLTQPAIYKYFQFEDPWWNNWEVAEYNY